jgi:hypothetical protein
MQLIDVVSGERVDGNVTDGWDNVMLRVEVVCTPRLRAPCTSPQGQPLGEPIADRGGQSSPPFRSGCLSFTSSLGERPAVPLCCLPPMRKRTSQRSPRLRALPAPRRPRFPDVVMSPAS